MKEYYESSILLLWECSKLTEECINISAAYSKSKDDAIFTKTILTKYDSDYINIEIRGAIKELFYHISKHGVVVSGSLQSSTKDKCVGFELVTPIDNNDNLMCDKKIIDLIEYLCQQIIVEKTMIKWCQNCGIKDIEAVLTTKLTQNSETLEGYLHHLKRPYFASAYSVQ